MTNQILVIGTGESPWDYLYIDNVLKGDQNTKIIYLGDSEKNMHDYCKKNDIDYYNLDEISAQIANIPKVRVLVRMFLYRRKLVELRKRYNNFAVVHVHFLTLEKLVFMKVLRKCSDKMIYTFWGSDLYRETGLKLKLKTRFLDTADHITFMTQDMKNYFDDNIKHDYNSKISIIDFGSEILDYIDLLIDNKVNCKCEIGLEENDIAIAIGYNGRSGQQHIKVLDEIIKLPQETRDRIVIILQMTYGLTDGYHTKILEVLKQYGFRYIEYTKYLNPNELAKIRMATDIFIHAQTTDAQAASVLEFLYAYKMVINPTWIKYTTLKKNNVFYEEYSDFGELPNLIMRCIDPIHKKKISNKLTFNHEFVKTHYSWSSIVPEWIDLYKQD